MTTGVPAYSTTPASNVQANTGINWDEGMSPGAVNNSARANMADLRTAFNDLIWFQYGGGTSPVVTPAYVASTQYKIAGVDVSAAYHVSRRTKAVGSGTGTIYGTISAVAFSTDTTVTVAWDSGALTNEALTIYLSQVPATGSPVSPSAIPGLSGIMSNVLNGLTLSTAGSSGTFAAAAGNAADSTNASMVALAALISKTTSSWAVGSGNGGLDTGAIANNTWYHVWLIKRIDTGVVDVLVSLSASAPTMPSPYTLKRRIGAMLTDGSAHWTKFIQLGDDFIWAVNVIDAAANTVPADSSAHLVTLSVPPGVQVGANFIANPGYNSTVDYWLFTSPDQTDTTPTVTINDVKISSSFIGAYLPLSRRTNTSGQIRVRAISSGGGSPAGGYGILTQGWTDYRGRLG